MMSISICAVLSVILIPLAFCTPLPQSPSSTSSLSLSPSSSSLSSLSPSSLLAQLAQEAPQSAQGVGQPLQVANGQSAPMTAQSVNSGINFTQQFMQLLGMLFNNFNSFVPRFMNLFTGQNPAAAGMPGQSISSLPSSVPSMPGLPSLTAMQAQSFNHLNLPEKINNAPATSRDTELSDNDIINNGVDILSAI